jgi:hypothetical protein
MCRLIICRICSSKLSSLHIYTPELTFKSFTNAGAKVAADVVAFDSRAPRKGRQLPISVMGDIPKILIQKYKSETDINRFAFAASRCTLQ